MSNTNNSEFPSAGKIIVIALLIFVGGMALAWLDQGNEFFLYKFFAPKREAVRREVYEQTKSYRQGSVQRLNNLCTQVNEADDSHKPMLKDVISHEFAEWDTADVPAYLRPCLATARAK